MITRRTFVAMTATGIAAGALRPIAAAADGVGRRAIKAIAFDGFVIFDPRPIASLAEALFPDKGAALTTLWRTRQFEYGWVRVLMNRYTDFGQITQDALRFAANDLNVDLTLAKRDQLMNAFLQMTAWPDVPGALRTLQKKGIRLAFLSNLTAKMLEANMRSAGLDGLFERSIATDAARTYKPDSRAYALGMSELCLKKEEILFVAFAGWDAAGAKSFGYSTFWVNRQKSPVEELSVTPDATGETMNDLLAYLG